MVKLSSNKFAYAAIILVLVAVAALVYVFYAPGAAPASNTVSGPSYLLPNESEIASLLGPGNYSVCAASCLGQNATVGNKTILYSLHFSTANSTYTNTFFEQVSGFANESAATGFYSQLASAYLNASERVAGASFYNGTVDGMPYSVLAINRTGFSTASFIGLYGNRTFQGGITSTLNLTQTKVETIISAVAENK